MTLQYLRRMSFSFNGGAGRTIYGGRDGELHLQATINATTLQSPNQASVRIWNPSSTLINQAKEFTRLTIQAGYDNGGNSSLPMIYSGDVKQALYGKANPVDTYLDVFCSDAGNAYQQSRVSKTLAAGYTPKDLYQSALDAMAPFGVTAGLMTADLSQPVYPRGIPLIGMARSLLRQVALSAGERSGGPVTWSIQNSQLCMVDHKQPLPGSAIILNSKTGMINIPTQTTDGIKVQCLSNTSIKVHGLVNIDQSLINQAEQDNSFITGGNDGTGNFNLNNTGKIASDGIYQVVSLERVLDTRGQDWYDFLTCIAQNGGNLNQGQINSGLTLAGPVAGSA